MGRVGCFLDYYPRINRKLMSIRSRLQLEQELKYPSWRVLTSSAEPTPSALGPWDWDPANSVLLCQLLPVRLCHDRALGGDCKAGGRGETQSSCSATYPP